LIVELTPWSTALFNMHRGFFAKALEDHTDNLQSSEYYTSVLATYNAACSYIGLAEIVFSRYPAHFGRIWCFFGQVFSCAVWTYFSRNLSVVLMGVFQVVLGTIALRKDMIEAPIALSKLETACSFFEQAPDQPRCAQILVSLFHYRYLSNHSLTSLDLSQPILRRTADQARCTLYPPAPTDSTNSFPVWTLAPELEPQHVNNVDYLKSPVRWKQHDLGHPDEVILSVSNLRQPHTTAISWPAELDIHYEGLDDIPNFVRTIPDQPMPLAVADPNVSWQNFMDRFGQG
jgi:hypothetical protein